MPPPLTPHCPQGILSLLFPAVAVLFFFFLAHTHTENVLSSVHNKFSGFLLLLLLMLCNLYMKLLTAAAGRTSPWRISHTCLRFRVLAFFSILSGLVTDDITHASAYLLYTTHTHTHLHTCTPQHAFMDNMLPAMAALLRPQCNSCHSACQTH